MKVLLYIFYWIFILAIYRVFNNIAIGTVVVGLGDLLIIACGGYVIGNAGKNAVNKLHKFLFEKKCEK